MSLDEIDMMMEDEIESAGSEASGESEWTPRAMYDGEIVDGKFEWSGDGTPPLYIIDQARHDFPVVGEERNFQCVYLTFAVGGGLIIFLGPARTGKDRMLDGVENALPEDFVYRVPDSMTEASFFEQVPQMNRAEALRFKDLVNIDELTEDALKSVGEGADFSRQKQVQTEEGNWETVTQTLRAPSASGVMLASDNKQTDINDYPELRDRGVLISTDPSRVQTERIMEAQTKMAAGQFEYQLSDAHLAALRKHVSSLSTGQWDVENGANPDFLHPYGMALADAEKHPIASLFPESRMDGNRFWKFVNIMALWHIDDRITAPVTLNGHAKDRVLVTPQDMWYAMRVYGEKLLLSALNLGDIDRRILWLLREEKSHMTVSAIANRVQKIGITAASPEIRKSCESMFQKNYLQKNDDGGKVEYAYSPFASNVEEYNTLDWDEVIEYAGSGIDTLVDSGKLPAQAGHDYVQCFLREPVQCVHPLSGEVVDITEYEAFEDQISKREDEIQQMIDGGYEMDTDDDDDDEEPVGETVSNDGLGSWAQ